MDRAIFSALLKIVGICMIMLGVALCVLRTPNVVQVVLFLANPPAITASPSCPDEMRGVLVSRNAVGVDVHAAQSRWLLLRETVNLSLYASMIIVGLYLCGSGKAAYRLARYDYCEIPNAKPEV